MIRIMNRIKLLALLCLLSTLLASGQAHWTWKDSHGAVKSREDLEHVLGEHEKWIEKNGGKPADFTNADLSQANFEHAKLNGAIFKGATLRGTNFTEADLSGADFSGAKLDALKGTDAEHGFTDFTHATLVGTIFKEADLAGAYFGGEDQASFGARLQDAKLNNANLANADFTRANLSRADLSGTTLGGADFSNATLKSAIYEPKDPTEPLLIGTAGDLADLTYKDNPQPLHDLRDALRNAGFTQPERDANRAIHRHPPLPPAEPVPNTQSAPNQSTLYAFERLHYRFQQVQYWLGQAMYWTQQVLFDWPCGWGADPGRPLVIIAVLALLCTPLYWIGMHITLSKNGLFLVTTGQRIPTTEARERVLRLIVDSPGRFTDHPQPGSGAGKRALALAKRQARWKSLRREYRALRTAFLFSLMSVFNIGFDGFDGGLWIRLLLPREFDIRARGWMRMVSGVQSLLGVGLLALAVLSYFGHPFE